MSLHVVKVGRQSLSRLHFKRQVRKRRNLSLLKHSKKFDQVSRRMDLRTENVTMKSVHSFTRHERLNLLSSTKNTTNPRKNKVRKVSSRVRLRHSGNVVGVLPQWPQRDKISPIVTTSGRPFRHVTFYDKVPSLFFLEKPFCIQLKS